MDTVTTRSNAKAACCLLRRWSSRRGSDDRGRHRSWCSWSCSRDGLRRAGDAHAVVTLARRAFEPASIEDIDAAVFVVNEASVLQRSHADRDAAASYAD